MISLDSANFCASACSVWWALISIWWNWDLLYICRETYHMLCTEEGLKTWCLSPVCTLNPLCLERKKRKENYRVHSNQFNSTYPQYRSNSNALEGIQCTGTHTIKAFIFHSKGGYCDKLASPKPETRFHWISHTKRNSRSLISKNELHVLSWTRKQTSWPKINFKSFETSCSFLPKQPCTHKVNSLTHLHPAWSLYPSRAEEPYTNGSYSMYVFM